MCIRDSNNPLQINANVAKPLGSGFKLYILGALADEIANGKLKWTEKYPIRSKSKSLPSGKMQNWEEGLLVTLKEYADSMISISDNTATDHLHTILGRNLVEGQLTVMKNSHPELNKPLINTAEFFKLKWAAKKSLIRSYINGSAAKKRKLLSSSIKNIALSEVGTNGVSANTPSFINEIEWFGSTSSMCSGMKVLLDKNSPEVLDTLSISTPQIDAKASKFWSYAGFKGGSEPGVFTTTYLLKAKNGKWGCLSLALSDEGQNINETVAFAFVKSLLKYSQKYFK